MIKKKLKLSVKEKIIANKFLSSENSKIFKLKNEPSYGLRKKKHKKGKKEKK